MALVGQAVSEKKIFEIVDGWTDGRTTDHGHPISSPCEPNGSGELKIVLPHKTEVQVCFNNMVELAQVVQGPQFDPLRYFSLPVTRERSNVFSTAWHDYFYINKLYQSELFTRDFLCMLRGKKEAPFPLEIPLKSCKIPKSDLK